MRLACAGLLLLVLVSFLSHAGCGSSSEPRPAGSTFVQLGEQRDGDREAVERALAAWDAQGWPALAIRAELRDPDPVASASLGEPALLVSGIAGRAWTFPPDGLVLVARGSERWIVHELLHVLHLGEGVSDPFHRDPRWQAVDAVARGLP